MSCFATAWLIAPTSASNCCWVIPGGGAGGAAGVAEYQAGSAELAELAARYPDYSHATQCDPPFAVVVDRQRAGFRIGAGER